MPVRKTHTHTLTHSHIHTVEQYLMGTWCDKILDVEYTMCREVGVGGCCVGGWRCWHGIYIYNGHNNYFESSVGCFSRTYSVEWPDIYIQLQPLMHSYLKWLKNYGFLIFTKGEETDNTVPAGTLDFFRDAFTHGTEVVSDLFEVHDIHRWLMTGCSWK